MRASRITFVGELGWELYIPSEFSTHAAVKQLSVPDSVGADIKAAVGAYPVPAVGAMRRIAEEIGRSIVQNIVMVGFFAGVTDLVGESAMREAVLGSVPAGTEELNLQAFEKGLEYARQGTSVAMLGFFDQGTRGRLHWFAMEFVDGEDLAKLIRRIGRLPADKGVEIARQICAGLAAVSSSARENQSIHWLVCCRKVAPPPYTPKKIIRPTLASVTPV